MNSLDKDLQKYYKEISRYMVCSRNIKRKLLSEVRFNINNYLEGNPNVTYQEIVERFGTPMEISGSYIDYMNSDDLASKVKKSRFVKIAVAMLFCIVIVFVITLFIDRQIHKPTIERDRLEIETNKTE